MTTHERLSGEASVRFGPVELLHAVERIYCRSPRCLGPLCKGMMIASCVRFQGQLKCGFGDNKQLFKDAMNPLLCSSHTD